MKALNPQGGRYAAALLGLGLALTGSALKADLVIDSFDANADAWSATWGSAPTLSFDTDDAAGAATSGSLKVTASYFTPEDNGWEQLVVTRTFPSPVTGSEYEAIAIDVKVDDSSVATAAGQYGYFELKKPDGTALGGVNLTSKEWTTIKFNLAPTEGAIPAILIQNGNSGFLGPVTLKLDNLRFIAPPAPQTVIDRFDVVDDKAGWTATWGTAPNVTWDALNAGGSDVPESGSLKVEANYFTPEDNGWEQLVITKNFATPVVGADHVSVSIDVKVDPSSTPTAAGQYGYFELKRTDGTALGGVNLTGTDWQTITFSIPATEGTLSGIIIQNGNSGFLGPVTLYLDNLVFTQRASGPQPPTLSIEKNRKPGLKLYASAPGQAYQRQNVVYAPSETLENNLWWVNQEPVSYSITWADFPNGTDYAGFQGHIILSRDTGKGNTPDWNDANVILIEFQYAGGQARARFLHKVNEPNGNAMLYRTPDNAAAGPVGVLGEVRAASMLGTWTLTMISETAAKITSPDGNSVDIAIPAEEGALYEPTTSGVSAQFGVQPNADSRIGLSAVISRLKITKGDNVVVDDDFTTAEPSTDSWIYRAADVGGLFPTPNTVSYLVSWPLPDPNAVLYSAPSVTGPWTAAGDPSLVGARRVFRVNADALPAAGSGYFRLQDVPAAP